MKRFSGFLAGAILAAGLISFEGGAGARTKSLGEQLVGTWTLVSCNRTNTNGEKVPYCVDPNGILIFDRSGKYTHMIASRNRPKLVPINRVDTPAEQFKAAAEGFVANFGTWRVNETERTVTRHYEGALIPNFEGTELKMSVSLSGNELTLVGLNPNPSLGLARDETVYRRAD